MSDEGMGALAFMKASASEQILLARSSSFVIFMPHTPHLASACRAALLAARHICVFLTKEKHKTYTV